jgi:hypothetical protein
MAALDIDGILRNDCSSPIAVAPACCADSEEESTPLLPITEPNITTMCSQEKIPALKLGASCGVVRV